MDLVVKSKIEGTVILLEQQVNSRIERGEQPLIHIASLEQPTGIRLLGLSSFITIRNYTLLKPQIGLKAYLILNFLDSNHQNLHQ